jgi:hypothetical protein
MFVRFEVDASCGFFVPAIGFVRAQKVYEYRYMSKRLPRCGIEETYDNVCRSWLGCGEAWRVNNCKEYENSDKRDESTGRHETIIALGGPSIARSERGGELKRLGRQTAVTIRRGFSAFHFSATESRAGVFEAAYSALIVT